MPTPAEVLKDENFKQLPESERLKVMQKLDQRFAALPEPEQLKVVAGPKGGDRQPTWADKLGVENNIGRGALDLVEGAASGAASTIGHLADMMPGTNLQTRQQGLPTTHERMDASMPTPDSKMGAFGKLIEQGAEFALPGGVVTRAVGKAALPVRMAAEAVSAAGVGGVQSGGDPQAMALAAAGGAAGPALGAVAKKVAPTVGEAANTVYAKALNATTKGNKLRTERVVPSLLKEGVAAFSSRGLAEKAGSQVEAIGQKLDEAFSSVPADAPGLPIAEITGRLKLAGQEAFEVAGKAPTKYAEGAMASLDDLAKRLEDYAVLNPATGAKELPIGTARQVRQAFDKVAKAAGRYEGRDLADHAAGEVHGMAADSIRTVLASEHPNIAQLNKEFALWRDVKHVIDDTVLRRKGQSRDLKKDLFTIAGAEVGEKAGGAPGAFIGGAITRKLAEAMESTGWRTISGVKLNQLAESLAEGNRGRVMVLVSGIVRAAQAGEAARGAQRTKPTREPAMAGAR